MGNANWQDSNQHEEELVVNSKNTEEISEVIKMMSKLTQKPSMNIANSLKGLSDSHRE